MNKKELHGFCRAEKGSSIKREENKIQPSLKMLFLTEFHNHKNLWKCGRYSVIKSIINGRVTLEVNIQHHYLLELVWVLDVLLTILYLFYAEYSYLKIAVCNYDCLWASWLKYLNPSAV